MREMCENVTKGSIKNVQFQSLKQLLIWRKSMGNVLYVLEIFMCELREDIITTL